MNTRKINLADADNSINSITTTYAGEFAGKYISAALLSGKTLAEGSITIKPNVAYKEVLKKVTDDANFIVDATCDFANGGTPDTFSLTERVLEPAQFQVNLQFCKKDFISDWESIAMGYSSYKSLPPKFSDFILGHVVAKVAEKTEQNIWQGDANNTGEFDGFTTLLANDSDVQDAANSSETSFTAGNIRTLLGNVVDKLPSAVYSQPDVTIYLPTAALQPFIRAMSGFGNNGAGAAGINNQGDLWYNQGNALSFEGIKLQHAPGLPSTNIVAGQSSNFYFGTGLLADHNEVKLIDLADIDGSQNVRCVMRYSAGVQYGIGSDIVLLTLA
jgi:hypothetical protein|tara:strand:+ start:2385 stop:3374 length:990 start_codon:yes stop_codon:yes gene_type:complete